MNISVNDVEWLVEELREQLYAGYKWSVLECSASSQQFEDVHLYYNGDIAEKYCESMLEKDIKVRLVETSILHQLMENIINNDKKRNDIDYYVLDDSSFSVSRVLKVNSDQNPLHNPDGNKFTEELINHFEMQNCDNKMDHATLLYPFIETDLMNYPLLELNNWGIRNMWVKALANGDLRQVTFEKSFVPADRIKDYVIVEQRTSIGVFTVQHFTELNSFKSFDEALTLFNNLIDKIDKTGDVTQLMLVGKYNNQRLEYNGEGDVQLNTGLTIDIYDVGFPSYARDSGKYPINPDKMTTVREQMYARFDAQATTMVYYDISTLEQKVPDKEFWNDRSVSLQKLEDKAKSNDGGEICLLEKKQENSGKGMKR